MSNSKNYIIHRPNLLIVCGRNKKRSRTGEFIFKNDNRFNVRSAGLSPNSDRKISETDLNWSNLVLVMENKHKVKIRDLYRGMELPEIEVLNIPDDYEFMDAELIEILTGKINNFLQTKFGI